MKCRVFHILIGLVLVLLLLGGTSVGVYAQDRTITLSLNQASFEEFVQQVEEQSGARLYYDRYVTDSLSVSVELRGASLSDALQSALPAFGWYATEVTPGRVYITQGQALVTALDGLFLPGGQELIHLTDYRDTVETIIAVENRLFEIGTKGQPGQERLLTGYVRDAHTRVPISMASVRVDGSGRVVITDQQGYFSITIPEERGTVYFSSVGKKDTRRQLLMHGNGRLDVDLDERVYALDEIVVSGQAGTGVTRTLMGVERLSMAMIKQTPTVFGEADVIRVVLTLPGVQTVGEAAGGFNVRGGATDQNLVLFSDATIYNPSHFFGFFSAFNPEAVGSIELYKSSVPARFGGRLASVLDVAAREGNRQEFSGSGGIGLLTGRLTLEGPLGPKTSFLVGGRSTYSDWLLKLIPDEQYRKSSASFYDVNMTMTHDLDDNNSLYLMGYFSQDHFGLSADSMYSYRNMSANLKWKSVYNSRRHSVVTAGVDGYEFAMDNTFRPQTAYRMSYANRQAFAKLDIHDQIGERHRLLYGLSTIHYGISPGNMVPAGELSTVNRNILPTEHAQESSLHITDVFDVTDRLTLDMGLRYSMFHFLGAETQTYHAPEWRVNARYAISPRTSVKLGYNSLMQYIHMLSNTTSITPTDTWKLSDRHIRPQSGDQASFGLYQNFDSDRIETSVEVYYKRIQDYLDYRGGARLLMNRAIHEDVLSTEARAYGVELLIKKLTGRLNGWLSYTYSKVEQRTVDVPVRDMINQGAYYPSNHDKPHHMTLVGNYKFSHRLSFSLNATYSTGRPITLPIAEYEYAGTTRVFYSDRNQYRIPDFFRIDASFNIEGNHKVRKLAHSSWTVGVYNVTGRQNPFSVYYLSEPNGIKGYKLSIFGSQIPFLTYNFKF